MKKFGKLIRYTILFTGILWILLSGKAFESLAQEYDQDMGSDTILVQGDVLKVESYVLADVYFYADEGLTQLIAQGSFESGSYTIGIYSEDSYPIPPGQRMKGWKLKAITGASVRNWQLYRVTETIETVSVNVIYGEGFPDVPMQIEKGNCIALEEVSRPGYVIHGFVSENSGTFYKTSQLETLPMTEPDTFTAQWSLEIPEGGILGEGAYYLEPGVPYRSSLGEGFTVNGGSDGVSYGADVMFYVGEPGLYTFGK